MPYSSARSSYMLVVIHTGEGILRRQDMAAYLDNNPDASAHAAADATGVSAPLVPYSRAAWTAGPTANSRSLQIELCAFAAMTREQWLSEAAATVWIPWLNAYRTVPSPMSMLRNSAAWTRDVCDTYGIPKVKLSGQQVAAGAKGICGHADTSYAFGETDHTDPGPNFPWDVFINLVNGEDVEWTDTFPELDAAMNEVPSKQVQVINFLRTTWQMVRQLGTKVDALTVKVNSIPTSVGGSPLTDAQLDAIAQRVIDFQKKAGN